MEYCTKFNVPSWVSGVFVAGMFRTASWVISVMLPMFDMYQGIT